MKKYLVITSIAKPNTCLKKISKKSFDNSVDLLIVGDRKSPKKFKLKNCSYLSLRDQKKLNFSYISACPENSYSRKNIGYLQAIKNGATIIFDSDDDNEPLDSFFSIKPKKKHTSTIKNGGWVNIYKYFSKKQIWPRGFPLSEIQNKKKFQEKLKKEVSHCPINQRLANDNPDVDAIYRLIKKIPFKFKNFKDIALGKNSWCPFNSQNTVWHKEAFLLLYLPSFSTFRMSDIWRSFIAQRICWENNWSILHSNSTVTHKRNDHDLMKDFIDEIPGYLNNKFIAENLNKLKLKRGYKNIPYNLIKCYKFLSDEKLTHPKELKLLNLWIKDMKNITINI